ncbi:membrane-associated protein, putative [Bodo saltans]|uniref:Membrane-associated protein, putative n=1 Tax=Bodo saltans TaxID=75058 RepID=A0A0S4JB08_BODSA|nr:membrane-associated protein, putative [Bodo saltans]|eukprot:CUG88572.1 membrane-associated protein, putative [Bodo saltans]
MDLEYKRQQQGNFNQWSTFNHVKRPSHRQSRHTHSTPTPAEMVLGLWLFILLLVAAHQDIIPASAATFNQNLVLGSNPSADGPSVFAYWGKSSTNCRTDSNYFRVDSSAGAAKDCHFTQRIYVTFARNFLLHPGGRVMIIMKGDIEGGSPDYSSLTVGQQECGSLSVKYSLGGDPIYNSATIVYTWTTRLMPNICSLEEFRNERCRAFGQLDYLFTQCNSGDSHATIDHHAATQGTISQSITEAVSRSMSGLEYSQSSTKTPSLSQSSSSSPQSTTTLSSTHVFSNSRSNRFALMWSRTLSAHPSSSFNVSVGASLTSTPVHTLSATPSQPSQSLDSTSSASPIRCYQLTRIDLLRDPVTTSVELVNDVVTTVVVVPPGGNAITTASHKTFEITTAPIARKLLLATSTISASFDFGDFSHWRIAQAEVMNDGMFVNFVRVISNPNVPNFVAIQTISNQTSTSAPHWLLPHDVSIYQSTTVEIQLQLQCAVIDATSNVTFRNFSALALRGIVGSLPPELVSSVVLRSQLANILAGVGAASGGGRLAAITVAQCDTGGGGVNGLLPFSVAVSSSCHFTSPHLDDINALVGNWVVVLVGTAAAGIACAVLCVAGSSSWMVAMRLLTFPLCVLPLWIAAVPSVAAAAIHLATTFPAGDDEACNSVAVLVVAAGLLLVAILVSSVVAAVWIAHKHFTHVVVLVVPPPSLMTSSLLQWGRGVKVWALKNNCDWLTTSVADKTVSIDRKLRPTRHVDALLSEFRVVGYSALDLVSTIIVSLIAGAALGAGTFSWCIGSLAFSLVLFSVQLCICVALRPHITWFYFIHSVTTQVLAILSVGLAIGSAVANSLPRQDVDLIVAMSTASAVVNLLSVGVVSVRTLIDLRSLVVALHRILQRLRRKSEGIMGAHEQQGVPTVPGADTVNLDMMMFERNDVPPDAARAEVTSWGLPHDDIFIKDAVQGSNTNCGMLGGGDDSVFWDADGRYRERRDDLGENAASSIILEVKKPSR